MANGFSKPKTVTSPRLLFRSGRVVEHITSMKVQRYNAYKVSRAVRCHLAILIHAHSGGITCFELQSNTRNFLKKNAK